MWRDTQPGPVADAGEPGELLPTYGATWPVDISREDGARLVGLALDALGDATGGAADGSRPQPVAAGPGDGCDAPVFVTLFVPGPKFALLSQRMALKIVAEKGGGSAAIASCWMYSRTWFATSGGTLALTRTCSK